MPVTTSGLIAGMDNLRVHHPIGGLGRKYQRRKHSRAGPALNRPRSLNYRSEHPTSARLRRNTFTDIVAVVACSGVVRSGAAKRAILPTHPEN